ncbi:MAG: hypothetical protein HYY04_12465 [Chloroflexi bacterium]|nr:hypothetical protein [Chloroflexota bacterium]
MKRIVALLALLTVVLAGIPPIEAAESLQMAVRPGFAGVVKLGSWVPVEVELQNAGPEVVGEVQIQVEGRTGRAGFNRPPVTYSVAVALPNRSRKRLSLDVFLPGFDEKVEAQLVASGQTLIKQPVSFDRVLANELFCGVMTGNRTGLDFLTALDLGGPPRRVRLAHLEPIDIPGAPHLLQSLDCLIVANISTSGLTAFQKEAVSHWVTSGGVLVVGGGAGVQKTVGPLPPDLLPVKVSGSVPVRSLDRLAAFAGRPLPERGPWLVGDAVVANGVMVVEQDGLPLLVAGQRGLGAVIYLGLDPTAEPLRSWEGNEFLWRYLLAQGPVARPSVNNFARLSTGWGRLPLMALADLTGVSRTSASWLVYLLLGYAVVVGPANYLALRRLGRLEWSVVTIPLVTLVAAGAVLAGARANPASDLVVNHTAILRSWDGDSAFARSYVSLFSLREQSPDLQLPEGSLVSPLYYPFPVESTSQVPDWALTVRQADRPDVARFALRPGALGTFLVDHLYRLPGRITGDLVVDETSVHGTVTSRFSGPIRHAAIVVGGEVLRLGDLRPGESRPVTLELTSKTVDLTRVVKQLYPTDADPVPPEEAAQRDLLQSAFNPAFNFSSRVESSPAMVVGWIDEAPLGNLASTNRATPLQRTLLVSSLPLRARPDEVIQVPRALILRRSLLATGMPRVQDGGLVFNAGDAVSWEHQLPFDLSRFVVEEVRLDLAGSVSGLSSSAPLSNPGLAHVYDWGRAEWTPVELEFGENRLTPPQRFVSPLGVVRYRYVFRPPSTGGPGARTASFSTFDLVVRGRAR